MFMIAWHSWVMGHGRDVSDGKDVLPVCGCTSGAWLLATVSLQCMQVMVIKTDAWSTCSCRMDMHGDQKPTW